MKYMLLIHQGSAPTPPSDEWESLSEDEKGEASRIPAARMGGAIEVRPIVER